MNTQATGGLMPCMTLLLDVDAALSLERSYKRLHQQDLFEKEGRFEKESLAFHKSVRSGYLKIAEKEPCRVKILNGAVNVGELASRIWVLMQDCLNLETIPQVVATSGESDGR